MYPIPEGSAAVFLFCAGGRCHRTYTVGTDDLVPARLVRAPAGGFCDEELGLLRRALRRYARQTGRSVSRHTFITDAFTDCGPRDSPDVLVEMWVLGSPVYLANVSRAMQLAQTEHRFPVDGRGVLRRSDAHRDGRTTPLHAAARWSVPLAVATAVLE